MLKTATICIALCSLSWAARCCGQAAPNGAEKAAAKVVDIPTRPGVTERMVVLAPEKPKAAVILFAGGHGGLQITPTGTFQWGSNNFLVRTRQLFADRGLLTVIVDAPSDRQNPPYLAGFRTSMEHVADIKAVIAWARKQTTTSIWLVGTSRGTESAAFAATQLAGPAGPDGIVLTSTILTDTRETPVTAMPLEGLRIPVLVVHHVRDGCSHCSYRAVPRLMQKLTGAPKKQLLSFQGGVSRGDPCQARSYHGFNGLDHDVVTHIADWILAK